MMILGHFRLCVLGASFALIATPSLAASAGEPGTTAPLASDGGARADARHARQVELPFQVGPRAPDREPQRPDRSVDEGPHPFREVPLKRASLTEPTAGARPALGGSLSRYGEFG